MPDFRTRKVPGRTLRPGARTAPKLTPIEGGELTETWQLIPERFKWNHSTSDSPCQLLEKSLKTKWLERFTQCRIHIWVQKDAYFYHILSNKSVGPVIFGFFCVERAATSPPRPQWTRPGRPPPSAGPPPASCPAVERWLRFLVPIFSGNNNLNWRNNLCFDWIKNLSKSDSHCERCFHASRTWHEFDTGNKLQTAIDRLGEPGEIGPHAPGAAKAPGKLRSSSRTQLKDRTWND